MFTWIKRWGARTVVGVGVSAGAFFGIDALIEREGQVNHAYLDSAGVPTICVGHVSDAEYPFKMGDVWSDRKCREVLQHDLKEAQAAIDRLVEVPLTNYQESALRSFIFNIGVYGFQKSTLLRELNAGCYECVPDQMMRWTKITVRGQKQVSRGLVNRRKSEVAEWRGQTHE